MICNRLCIICLVSIWACGGEIENDFYPQAYSIEIVDSIKITEKNGFLSKPSNSTLINDSLIGVESFQSKGVWILNRKTGEEISSVISNQEKGIQFRPTKVFWKDFPLIYVLDGMTKKIHLFNLDSGISEGQKHISSISLLTPDHLAIKPLMANLFYKISNRFYIEQFTNLVSLSSNDFYKLTDKLVGVYESDGGYIESFIDYPIELKNLEKFIAPGVIYSSGIDDNNNIYLTFPFKQKIEVFSEFPNQKKIKTIPLPKSNYFTFQIPFLNQEISNDPNVRRNEPVPHYFGDIIVKKEKVLVQTFMKPHLNPSEFPLTTSILKYNEDKLEWIETTPKSFSDLGFLAGIVGDSLFFVEAGLLNSEEKYIKHAVLKPIED